jgi:hypothetical protein
LTSINERQYQIPFCQVLSASGETILYTSSHGPFEKGKDIITRTVTGEIRAYQLKMADIGLSEWRDIHGEINNLVELPIEHVSAGLIATFTPYLVTNGELTDPVLDQVRVANLGWKKRGFPNALKVIQKGELLDRFQTAHGAYLPRELVDFRTFLELVLRDGAFVAEKRKAALLLEHVLAASPGQSQLNVGRAAASAVLLTAYITRAAEAAGNHWACFEYWVLAAAYILRLGEQYGSSEPQWSVSFDLCEASADRAVAALEAECQARANLVEGNPLVDGHTYSSRVTVLTGLLAAAAIRNRLRHQEPSDFALHFIQGHLKQASVWGESAIPYLVLAAIHLECECRPFKAEALLLQMLAQIISQNRAGSKSRGLPNPYYSTEEAIRLYTGLDSLNPEAFAERTYTAETLIQMLARRWRRQALTSLWRGVTRMQLSTYMPQSAPEWFRWRSSEGAVASHVADEPQSWEQLRTYSEQLRYDELPKALIARSQFVPWFMLVYPHRMTPQLVQFLETALRS